MCDRMRVAILVDSSNAPAGGGTDAAKTDLWTFVRKAGLGTIPGPEKPESASSPSAEARSEVSEPEPRESIERDRRYTLVIKERLRTALADFPGDIIEFELTAGPWETCICNATWNNYSPPEPHPERAPIVSFLHVLLDLPYVRAAAFFYGPSGIPDPEAARGWEVTPEPASAFIEHFYTEEAGKIIGKDASGFFLVRHG